MSSFWSLKAYKYTEEGLGVGGELEGVTENWGGLGIIPKEEGG